MLRAARVFKRAPSTALLLKTKQIRTLASSQQSPMSTSSKVKLVLRPSHERGHADHGWLKSFHTWNFASYYNPSYDAFGALRVMNEDRVSPKEGFGTHSHKEFEIFSYIVSGELEHRDSMGNIEVMKRGDIQLTSAGTGISHSEKTHGSKEVHFLQIWTIPSVSKLTPKYFARHFSDAEKLDKLVPVVAPIGSEGVSDVREGTGPAPVQSPVTLYATILSPGKSVVHTFPAPQAGNQRKAYIHVIQTSGYNAKIASGGHVKVNDALEMREGDGAFAWGARSETLEIKNTGNSSVEVLVFDVE